MCWILCPADGTADKKGLTFTFEFFGPKRSVSLAFPWPPSVFPSFPLPPRVTGIALPTHRPRGMYASRSALPSSRVMRATRVTLKSTS